MTDHEKTLWLKALLSIWGPMAVPILLAGFMPGPRPMPLDQWAWMFIVGTGTYLLILSWRSAYLSGRKKR